MFLLFDFFVGPLLRVHSCAKIKSTSFMLKSYWWWWWVVAYSECQLQSLLVLDLIGTWLGFGTRGLGLGLDNVMLIKLVPLYLPFSQNIYLYLAQFEIP